MLRAESYKKGILFSTGFNVLNKGLAFVNNLAIAYFFGTQLSVDVYFYTFNTIILLVTYLNSVNVGVLVPESMKIRASGHPEKAFSFFNVFIAGYVLLTALLCAIAWINPIGIFTSLSKFDKVVLEQEFTLMLWVIPLLMLISITNLLTEIIVSYRFFSMPMIAGSINSTLSFVMLLVFHDRWGMLSVVAGLIISHCLNIGLLVLIMLRGLHWKFSFVWVKIDKKVWQNIGMAQLGNLATVLSAYAPLYLLSGFPGGVVAAFNYAQQIVVQPTNLLTNQFASVSRIRINELYVSKDYSGLNRVLASTIRFLLFLLVPVCGILFLFPEQVVTVLLKRGSFSSQSVADVSVFLRFLALSVPFTAVWSIVSNLFVSAQLIKQSVWYQIFNNLLLIAFTYLGLQWLGKEGYPLAYLAINVMNVLAVQWFCKRYFPYIKYSVVLRYILLLVLLMVVILGGIWFIRIPAWLPGGLPQLLLASLLAMGLLLMANRFFYICPEINDLFHKVRVKFLGNREEPPQP